MALYVYGLMRAQDARSAADSDHRAVEPALRAVEHQGVGALVSAVPEGSVPGMRRESLMAYTEVLSAAFEYGPVLPVRYGSVLPNEGHLERELLAPQAERLLARLEALAGKVEMQVKATYLEEPLLRSILSADPRLAGAAQRIRELPAPATHFERIRVGEAIGAAVDARRTLDAQKLLGALGNLAVAISAGELQHERMVLNAAFLVQRGGLDEFDAAVERLSQEHSQQMQFKLIGPLPTHSFADREWELHTSDPGRRG